MEWNTSWDRGIRRQRERVYRPRHTYLSLSEEECRRKLRLTRQAVTDICHLLADELGTDARCPYALPIAVKITAALHFYASGSFQHPLSCIGRISQSAVSSAIHAVTSGLVQHAGEYIKFPVTPDSQERTKQELWTKYGFPGVLGAIDCTHVQLRAPSLNALTYINRKGTHSINIQVISDANCRINHVFANYPGSSHDSFILANSTIPVIFEGNPPLDGWLLGDNGYPLKTWLMTPFLMPATVREMAFNRKHTQTRSVIERTFGILKMRFRCLDRSGGTLQYGPQKVAAFFVACCVLHNIAMNHGCVDDINEDRLGLNETWCWTACADAITSKCPSSSTGELICQRSCIVYSEVSKLMTSPLYCLALYKYYHAFITLWVRESEPKTSESIVCPRDIFYSACPNVRRKWKKKYKTKNEKLQRFEGKKNYFLPPL